MSSRAFIPLQRDGADRYWRDRAKCRTVDPEVFYPLDTDEKGQERALWVCFGCPVRAECLEEAFDQRDVEGVRGGTTGAERRSMLRRKAAPLPSAVAS